MQIGCLPLNYYCKMEKEAAVKLKSQLEEVTFKNNHLETWRLQALHSLNALLSKDNLYHPTSLKTITQELFKDFEEGRGIAYIPTYYPDLDYDIQCFHKGDIVIIASRPGMGKTTLVLNILRRQAERGEKGLYITFEENTKRIAKRLMSAISEVPVQNMGSKFQLNEEKIQLFEAKYYVENLPIFLEDGTFDQPNDFFEILADKIVTEKLQIVYLDGLQTAVRCHYDNENAANINSFLLNLKKIAMAHKIPIVITSQLNRSVESRRGEKRPMLFDLKGSGAIEDIADKILFVYRAEYYGLDQDWDGNSTKNVMDLTIAKNKMGTISMVNFKFIGRYCQVNDWQLPSQMDINRLFRDLDD